MNDIRWEDPPASGAGHRTKWSSFREQLIANPERWALMHKGPRGTVSNRMADIKRSRGAWRDYRWEVASRTIDGEERLYVRCLGPLDGES